MATIFHITTPAQWQEAARAALYRGDTLDTEGFIHCSTSTQVVRVADARFRGRSGLVLLCIDSDKVRPEIRYEEGEVGELFPHIYGALNTDAVSAVLAFEPNSDGRFSLPPKMDPD